MSHSVLHILGSAQREGAGVARIVAGLACGLKATRYTVHAYFLGEHGPLVGELEAAGAQSQVLNLQGHGLSKAWQLWCGLRRHQFSIIHQHAGGPLLTRVAKAFTGAALVLHLHGRVVESKGSDPVPIRIHGADVVIATSRAVAQQVTGMTPRVIYPGVPIPGCPPNRSDDPKSRKTIIGTGCRLVPIKGISNLVRAFSLLHSEFPQARLEIAGEGPEGSRIAELVDALGLNDCVTLLGWRSDFASVLANWDIFVLPSLEEAFGIAAVEAMAAGLPIVASAVGGLLEVVEDGETGWLVPARDPVQLAERLRMLLLEPERRERMGIQGHARARAHFSEQKMVAEITGIYDQLV